MSVSLKVLVKHKMLYRQTEALSLKLGFVPSLSDNIDMNIRTADLDGFANEAGMLLGTCHRALCRGGGGEVEGGGGGGGGVIGWERGCTNVCIRPTPAYVEWMPVHTIGLLLSSTFSFLVPPEKRWA